MKITIFQFSDRALENRDYSDGIEIHCNDEEVFRAFDGELEDNSLSRNFSDVWKISELMLKAYEAGKNGEDFKIEYKYFEE